MNVKLHTHNADAFISAKERIWPHQHLNDWDMNKSGFTTEQIYIYAKKKEDE